MNAEDELYKENILDHYRNPHNKRTISNPTFSYKAVNTSCGDEITVFLSIQNSRISDASFTGKGCAISQASISMLTDHIKGKNVEELNKIDENTVLELLGISIGPSRRKCAMLSLNALKHYKEGKQ